MAEVVKSRTFWYTRVFHEALTVSRPPRKKTHFAQHNVYTVGVVLPEVHNLERTADQKMQREKEALRLERPSASTRRVLLAHAHSQRE